MNILIVKWHPIQDSTTEKIANNVIENIKRKWDDFEVYSLYDEELRQWFLEFEENKQTKEYQNKIKFWQDKITWADEIVLIYPIWWLDAPAIVKNWFDVNFSAWFAYKYWSGWKVIKLFKGKTARLFVTCDGPWWLYMIFPISIKYLWKLWRFGFCGVGMKSYVIIDKVRERKKVNWWIDYIKDKVDKVYR